MKLYIQIENGQPINHPAFEDNLLQAFGAIPAHWEEFVRPERPVPTVYQIIDSELPTYAKVDGVWTDVWTVRDLTAEEKAAKQQTAKDRWTKIPDAANFSGWVFNEDTCDFEPPIPFPEAVAGVLMLWCGAENNWKEAPTRPVDGGPYKFDFSAWNWVAA